MRTSPAARISRGSGCVARFGLHIAARLRHMPGSPPTKRPPCTKGPASPAPPRWRASSIPRTRPRSALSTGHGLCPCRRPCAPRRCTPCTAPQPPEQPRGLSAWQSHMPRLHRRRTAHAAHATTISRTPTVGRLNSKPKITARLLSTLTLTAARENVSTPVDVYEQRRDATQRRRPA